MTSEDLGVGAADVAQSLRNGAVSLFLVAYTDGREPKVVRAVSARGALLSRLKDDEDGFGYGIAAVWRLGNFPAQFDVTTADVREIGNPSVTASTTPTALQRSAPESGPYDG